jgi:hypothetical protein
MKILVFYRSREYSNAIISSTKSKLEKMDLTKGLNVEFVNLDKRNYIKVLSQMEELPRFVYIWYDEEKVTDYINETYPSIEVSHFDVKNSVKTHSSGWMGYTTKEYKLADLIIEKFKENLEKKVIYQVDELYQISKVKMDDMDIACSKYNTFETEDKVKQYCIDNLKKDIASLENRIEMYQSSIKNCKTDLRKKNTLLKKYEGMS